jgi:type I restriction enzyme, S subunit
MRVWQTQFSLQQVLQIRERIPTNFEQLKNFSHCCSMIQLKNNNPSSRHIETECARIDAKIVKTLHATSLLAEYRTALISEVVTGKIRVT